VRSPSSSRVAGSVVARFRCTSTAGRSLTSGRAGQTGAARCRGRPIPARWCSPRPREWRPPSFTGWSTVGAWPYGQVQPVAGLEHRCAHGLSPWLSWIADTGAVDGVWSHRSGRDPRLGRSRHRQLVRLRAQPASDPDGVRLGFLAGLARPLRSAVATVRLRGARTVPQLGAPYRKPKQHNRTDKLVSARR
jgi:hypothetical protein